MRSLAVACSIGCLAAAWVQAIACRRQYSIDPQASLDILCLLLLLQAVTAALEYVKSNFPDMTTEQVCGSSGLGVFRAQG
jgi:hypothetical protein